MKRDTELVIDLSCLWYQSFDLSYQFVVVVVVVWNFPLSHFFFFGCYTEDTDVCIPNVVFQLPLRVELSFKPHN